MAGFYEFGGVRFGPRISDLVPAINQELFSTERHIPYSNSNVIDIGGRGPLKWAAQIRVTWQDAPMFETALGQTYTLYIAGRPYENATLIKLENHQITPLPAGDADPLSDGFQAQYHIWDAEWIISGTTP